MSVSQQFTFRCDLCGSEEKAADSCTPPKWKKMEIEDSYEERSWHTKHVCPKCVAELRKEP